MGGASSVAFSREELEVYEAVTNLTGAEIIVLYNKFMALGGRKGACVCVCVACPTGGEPMCL